MNRNQCGERGYSLAEMLTVLAIIGVMALVTIPAFMTFYQSNKMKSSMRNFESDLRTVRQLSITQGHQAMLCYGTGASARTYDYYLGDRPFNSQNWTKYTGTAIHPTRILDNVVYFPTNGASTPQTFTDILDCSSGTNCVAGTDNRIDVIFNPDGSVLLPTGVTSATITIKTDMKIPKSQYAVTISPSGRVLAQ